MTQSDTNISDEDLRLTAFPCHGPHQDSEGMSLREYFAAHCPSDLCSINVSKDREDLVGRPFPENDCKAQIAWNMEVEAILRFIYADAMLRARKAK